MNEEQKNIAIQDTYGEKFQNCWGCGANSVDGLHIHSYPSEKGDECICNFLPDKKFTGGVPNNIYGGMISMIFDCHGTASAAWFAHRNKGLDFTEDTVMVRYITARLEIDFRKPVPINKTITVISNAEEIGARKVIVNMKMKVDKEVCAESRMIAVAAKDGM